MAVISKIKFRGFDVEEAYIKYKSHSVECVENTSKSVYVCNINIRIFKDKSKIDFLESDTITIIEDDMNNITVKKIWEEVKKKYNGIDII